MKPTHRPRLSVSKPTLDHRTQGLPERPGLFESRGSNPRNEVNSSGPAVPSAGVRDTPVLAVELARPPTQVELSPFRKGCTVLSPSAISSDGPLTPPVVTGTVEIEVEGEERRPFELGDLLTREFAARNSGFLISLAFHTLVMLLLSCVLIHGTGKALIVLQLLNSPDIQQDAGVIAEFDVEVNDLDELVSAVNQDLFNSTFGESDGDQQVTDSSQFAGTAGNGDKTQGQGDGKSAKFFGTRAMGNKFVYVLDRSGSMAYESADVPGYKVSRFDVARVELLNSVESLRPHQEFYVVLFSTGMQLMFNQESLVPAPVKATPENKARLKEWLWRDQANGGTDPRSSLKLAFKMNPDAIFMLSDGEFRDEKKDGNPLAIDITRQKVKEGTPIRINSIALEDDASKVNLEELSAVSGGQFKFVKVKDYISNMAKSPAEIFRSRVPDQTQVQLAVSWSQREVLAKKLIQILDSRTQADRQDAEKRLHELSFGVFESVIPSVASSDIDRETMTAAIDAWTEAWAQADDQSNLDPSTPIGLFSKLAIVDNKDFLDAVETLEVARLSPMDQIAVARSILFFQRSSGDVTRRSTALLLDVLRELNRQSTAEFKEARFLEKATLAACEQRLTTVLKNRRLRASRLEAQLRNKRLIEEVRIEIAKDLVTLYPETKAARQAAERFSLPVTYLNETE